MTSSKCLDFPFLKMSKIADDNIVTMILTGRYLEDYVLKVYKICRPVHNRNSLLPYFVKSSFKILSDLKDIKKFVLNRR